MEKIVAFVYVRCTPFFLKTYKEFIGECDMCGFKSGNYICNCTYNHGIGYDMVHLNKQSW